MLSGRWRTLHFQQNILLLRAISSADTAEHRRNFADLRSRIEKLARLIQADDPTNKKGTSIATSAHFAVVRALCVSSVFGSCQLSTNQSR